VCDPPMQEQYKSNHTNKNDEPVKLEATERKTIVRKHRMLSI
jgi:hypothetical protein